MGLTKRIRDTLDRDPVILSHHPLCGRFSDHVFKIGGRYVCAGCVTIYPSALVAVSFLMMAGLDIFSVTLPIAVLAFGVYLLRFPVKGRGVRIPLNIFLGVSLGASLMSAFNAPNNQQLVVIAAGLAVAATFSFLKGRHVFVKCRKCERYSEFPTCCFPKSAQSPLTPT